MAKREPRAGDRLPYAGLIGERTVLLRDGALMQVLHVGGLAFETADTVELNHKQATTRRTAAARSRWSSCRRSTTARCGRC